MQYAKASIDQIPSGPKFKNTRRAKAEVATWLAWQAEPDHGLWQAVKPGLLDEAGSAVSGLEDVAGKAFPAV